MTQSDTATTQSPSERPAFKGWLHLATFPIAILVGTIAVSLGSSTRERVAVAIFYTSAALLFGVSGGYHRREWGPRAHNVLQRLDHASIFVLIAGTYTPFAVLLLPPSEARILLLVVWTGAAAGMAFRVFWVDAPRWLYTPTYVVLGWAALAYLPDFLAADRHVVLALAAIGGMIYTVGAVIYATRRPRLSPRWFGFHELFHALTVAAFITHCAGVALAMGDGVTAS